MNQATEQTAEIARMHLAIDAIVPRLEERAALTCSERRVPDETLPQPPSLIHISEPPRTHKHLVCRFSF